MSEKIIATRTKEEWREWARDHVDMYTHDVVLPLSVFMEFWEEAFKAPVVSVDTETNLFNYENPFFKHLEYENEYRPPRRFGAGCVPFIQVREVQ